MNDNVREKPGASCEPMFDKVAVRPEKLAEGETRGGVFIPTPGNTMKYMGTVVATGPGAFLSDGTRRPMSLRVGDRVAYNPHAGAAVRVGDEDLTFMSETDVNVVLSRAEG